MAFALVAPVFFGFVVGAIVVTGPVDPVDNTRSVSVEVSYNFQFLMPYLPDGVVGAANTW